jgi:hypothetical protein
MLPRADRVREPNARSRAGFEAELRARERAALPPGCVKRREPPTDR